MQKEKVILAVLRDYKNAYLKDCRDRLWTVGEICQLCKRTGRNRLMIDIKSSEERSRNMSKIRSKDTKLEVWLKKNSSKEYLHTRNGSVYEYDHNKLRDVGEREKYK